MASKKKSSRVTIEDLTPRLEIHDHQDGMQFCIECNGACRQRDAALVVTRLVRSIVTARFKEWSADAERVAVACGVPTSEIDRLCDAEEKRQYRCYADPPLEGPRILDGVLIDDSP